MTSDASEGRIYPHSWRLRLIFAIAVVAIVCLVALLGYGTLRI